MFENIGEKLKSPFLFGIGGIGDFLMMLSDGNYDSMDDVSVVFWANNPGAIKSLCKSCFPKINNFILPNYLSNPNSKKYLTEIINDPMFVSKAHIPDNLDYINEWYGVNVFEKYNIKRNPEWAINYSDKLHRNGEYWVVSPTGGSSDTDWKHKFFKRELFENFLDEHSSKKLKIISTTNDIDNIYGHDFIKNNLNRNHVFLLDQPFDELFNIIYNSTKVYSVDTWVKSLSLFMDIPTVLIRSFYSSNRFSRMGLERDPADFIFLVNWNFNGTINQ